jgi:hypothetical protein
MSGMALIPYIALPSEGFSWQRFAGVYSGGPSLTINYDTGAPGSSFTVIGFNYPANQTVTVKVNNHLLGTTTTDEIGGFTIRITSAANTDEGFYEVKVEVELESPSSNALSAVSAASAIRFQILAGAPLRAPEGTGTAFALPDGIAATDLVYMPLVMR